MLEGLRFANARERFTLHFAHKPDDPKGLSSIAFNPPCQIFKGRWIEFDGPHNPSFATASSNEIPPARCMAASSRCFMGSDLRRYAVSRSELISFQSAIGTITAVGSPASLDTIWMSVSDTTSVYLFRTRGGFGLYGSVLGCLDLWRNVGGRTASRFCGSSSTPPSDMKRRLIESARLTLAALFALVM